MVVNLNIRTPCDLAKLGRTRPFSNKKTGSLWGQTIYYKITALQNNVLIKLSVDACSPSFKGHAASSAAKRVAQVQDSTSH